MSERPSKFYLGLAKKGVRPIGHTISFKEPALFEEAESEPLTDKRPNATKPEVDVTALTFESVFGAFVDSMESYRRFISLLLFVAPELRNLVADIELREFADKHGTLRKDKSSNITSTYELNMSYFREFQVREAKIIAATAAVKHLPAVMIIGLVSVYDAFLAHLLRTIFSLRENLVMTSEKSIKFSELTRFSSIEDARRAIIDDEVESVLRMGHDEQFDAMQRKFAIQLRVDLPIWPQFVELCERRNLLTHTGGIVSRQYLDAAKEHKFDVAGIKVGDRLTIDPKYFAKAVETIYEIGIKLCSVLWRKFAKEQREAADTALNDLAFELISDRAYGLAETLLRFGTVTLKEHSSENVRRMMVVNRANALRLLKQSSDALDLIRSEDWSASSQDFLVCVAAIEGMSIKLLN